MYVVESCKGTVGVHSGAAERVLLQRGQAHDAAAAETPARHNPCTWSSAMGGTTLPNTSIMLPFATGGGSGGTAGGCERPPLAKRCCTSARSSCNGPEQGAVRQPAGLELPEGRRLPACQWHAPSARTKTWAPAHTLQHSQHPPRLTTPVCTARCTSSATSLIISAAAGSVTSANS